MRCFELNRMKKCMISFASFCWLWDFSARKSEIKKKTLMMSTGTYVRKLYVQNNIFKKAIQDMGFWIIYNLVQISFFGRLLKGILAIVFLFFPISQPWWPTFLLSPPSHHKKSSYLLLVGKNCLRPESVPLRSGNM